MTTLDRIILAIALLQILAIGLMAVSGFLFYATYKRGKTAVQPALDEVHAIAGSGKALADRARRDGLAAVNRTKAVVAAVKRRAATTVRIAKEIKPGAQAAVSEAQRQRAAAVEATQRLTAITRGLGRIRGAAESAARAAREPEA